MRSSRFEDMPDRVASLPVDERGFPVPWFVAWFDGRPDFRVVHTPRYGEAWTEERCWVCGQRLGSYRAWVMGPVSVIEGATPEPPAHVDCGQFAARHCPFLANPQMRRSARELPAHGPAAGVTTSSASAVTAVWVTKGRGAQPVRAPHGVMFRLSDPVRVEWYLAGRPAQAHEVCGGLELGLPILREAAERQGGVALADLQRRLDGAKRWLPRPV